MRRRHSESLACKMKTSEDFFIIRVIVSGKKNEEIKSKEGHCCYDWLNWECLALLFAQLVDIHNLRVPVHSPANTGIFAKNVHFNSFECFCFFFFGIKWLEFMGFLALTDSLTVYICVRVFVCLYLYVTKWRIVIVLIIESR